ncbi:hypothetical protein B1813_02550 [Saccharomonospora piscinae]|uniref:Nitroreductase family protein n=1 Tax=Saccharomonospora piscinae TaxID=687388 RepID=A0A1V9ADG0_SACPI|nr:hypothetical protein [Saccharomonospora piscinae]OQO94964.1 hypothetical protein B1813_02550 [Saccharomonospora piscinae]
MTPPFADAAPPGRTPPALDLPAVLTRATTVETPGPPVPPGPRVNPWHVAGAVPVRLPDRERRLLEGLWRGTGTHRLPDGTASGIRQRPVPSAGAAYPVQTHLVVGRSGGGELEAGRYVYDHERATLLRRDEAREEGAGWTGPAASTPGTRLILTVQPGRSFGRYRHRCWPLWIADVAYALAAVEFLLATRAMPVTLGPSGRIRELLGVAPGADHERWLARGLVPEIPLAALDLPAAWTVAADRSEALGARRSPALREFEDRVPRVRDRRTEGVARASGQGWVRGAARVRAWSVASGASAPDVATALWSAHRGAASECYEAARSGRWRCRPVSGFAARDGRWIVHALAMLPGRDRP